jgi:hypothetical protein
MDDIETLVREILPSMSDPFDTHELIIKLARQNQRSYVDALQRVNGEAPFQTLHSMIGKYILKMADEFDLSHSAWSSPDIFGNDNSCVRWTKIK